MRLDARGLVTSAPGCSGASRPWCWPPPSISCGTGLNDGLLLSGQASIRISTLSICPNAPEYMDDFDTADGTLELIRKRQQTSPKRLVAPGPTSEQVQTLFEAAAQAPDHGLILPWRFVRVSEAARGQLGEAFAAALLERDPQATAQQLQNARDKAQRAPFLALAIVEMQGKNPDIPVAERFVSLGCALQNMLLMAHAQGFGAGLVSGQAMQSLALRTLFGLEAHEQAVCFIATGTVKTAKASRNRPSPDVFVRTL
ncbi:nitroreductase [Thiomonas sp. X19]|nr:nitroreductase [Thiomonas sp. X19]